MELIELLRTVTEGKIYVENERARVTRTLAAIYEKEDQKEKDSPNKRPGGWQACVESNQASWTH